MPRRRRGAGCELRDHRDEVVDAVHRFDDDAKLAQLVAPHVFDQLGVVAPSTQIRLALATCARAPAPATEPLLVMLRRLGRSSLGRTSVTGLPVEQEAARLERKWRGRRADRAASPPRP